jgi:hypothetical protein
MHPFRSQLKHLGSLRGRGMLMDQTGGQSFGTVDYEIDGYLDQATRSGNGRIAGGETMLRRAFRAGQARIALADGQIVDIVLDDPLDDTVVEITVGGRLPEFGRS